MRFVTKSHKIEKSFFLFQLPLCYTFAVAPLCLHFFIYVRAKEERRNSEGRAKEQRTHPQPPPWVGELSVDICIFEIIVALSEHENIYKLYVNVSKASRRHLEHMLMETARRIINKATVNG